jgi:hypothetical protein
MPGASGPGGSGEDREIAAQRTLALGGVLAALAGGLALVALVYPGLFIGRPGAPVSRALSAYAFLISGLLLSAVCLPIGRRRGVPCRRIAAVARWLLPAHLMLPLVFMDVHGAFGVRAPWLAGLLLAAARVHRRERGAPLAALPGRGARVPRGVVRARGRRPPPRGDAALAIVSLAGGARAHARGVAGAGVLLAKRRLQRWTRAADARPDPEARRTWR